MTIPTDGKLLTSYHLGILVGTIKRTFDAFVDAWHPVANLSWHSAEIETTPSYLLDDSRLPQSQESVVSAEFQVRSGEFSDLSMSICYPAVEFGMLMRN